MKTTIKGARVLTPMGLKDGLYVTMEGGIITDIAAHAPKDPGQVVDAAGMLCVPGCIDLHVHGGGGHDFSDATAEAFIGAAQAHMLRGTTTMLPTTVCCPPEELDLIIAALKAAQAADAVLPYLPGLHVEGPWISPKQAGAQDPRYILTPDDEAIQWVTANAGDVARVTAAPELPGALTLGDALKERGIVASIGHSDANYQEVQAAVKHGYTLVTHLYSGMSTLHRVRAMRVLGVVESAYLLNDLHVEIIADGKHLPPELLQLIVRCKPWDHICLVTDGTRGMGLADGSEIMLGSLTSGQRAIVEGGVAYLPDFSVFAGSVASSVRCVRTMVEEAHVPIEDAVRMMTLHPSRVLGLEAKKGTLAVGMDADIVCLTPDWDVRHVFAMGRHAVRDGQLAG
ncbi:MAG: N-acetylglucosamine-6-phosphate deacetylase [Clostridiales bacterium]|nr:N-acetylglucosamine-6-phosphate deacetylase [Clostridiales bacterium]